MFRKVLFSCCSEYKSGCLPSARQPFRTDWLFSSVQARMYTAGPSRRSLWCKSGDSADEAQLPSPELTTYINIKRAYPIAIPTMANSSEDRQTCMSTKKGSGPGFEAAPARKTYIPFQRATPRHTQVSTTVSGFAAVQTQRFLFPASEDAPPGEFGPSSMEKASLVFSRHIQRRAEKEGSLPCPRTCGGRPRQQPGRKPFPRIQNPRRIYIQGRISSRSASSGRRMG